MLRSSIYFLGRAVQMVAYLYFAKELTTLEALKSKGLVFTRMLVIEEMWENANTLIAVNI